jgi:dTDP-4-amino-4,6-dideoxygalactose transaminase
LRRADSAHDDETSFGGALWVDDSARFECADHERFDRVLPRPVFNASTCWRRECAHDGLAWLETLMPEAARSSEISRVDALPMSSDSTIHVTRPDLPPLEEFVGSLQAIWHGRILTNGGPFHERFERALAEHLGVEHLSLFANGTIALVTALQALRITGEVITTPYSFVATAHSLLWNGIKPVFVDIDPKTLNLDPARIEAAITPQTTAILPVHVYGQPCDVEAIQGIADVYNLRVVYDAAHAFGVRVGDAAGSVARRGDISMLSFHATKVFNTFEGGALVCQDARTKRRIDHLKNFGFVDEVTVVAPGINGKMNEFSAALGLLQLERVGAALERRRQIAQRYREGLAGVPGIRLIFGDSAAVTNNGYFPILVGPDYSIDRDALYWRLREVGIHGRRYFYPLISDFPMYRGLPSAARANLPVAVDAAARVLCLPIYPDLREVDQSRVIDLICQG